jgi:DNA-binding transcriptional LysR family regulator
VKLLDRDRQSVRLTPAGQAVLIRSRKLVQDADLLLAEARMLDEKMPEELQVGYAPSPTAVVISEILARYHEVSPGARVTLHDLSNREMLSRLRANKLHAALLIWQKNTSVIFPLCYYFLHGNQRREKRVPRGHF